MCQFLKLCVFVSGLVLILIKAIGVSIILGNINITSLTHNAIIMLIVI